MGAVLDGGVLGRQTEGVPTDRVQDVEPAQSPVAREHIADGECLGMTHVEVTGGVCKHVEDVAALLGTVVKGCEGAVLLPVPGPLLLGCGCVVARRLAHLVAHVTPLGSTTGLTRPATHTGQSLAKLPHTYRQGSLSFLVNTR